MIKAVQPSARQRRQLRTPNPEVRRQFMAAAAGLLREEGFQALRVEQIAERAGLSIGTFYLYFESKDDLFVAMVIGHTEWLKHKLESALGNEGPVMRRLARALDAYLDFVQENEPGFLHYRDLGNVETTVGPLSAWALTHTAAALIPSLDEGMKRGEIRASDPALLAQALVGLTQHMAGCWLQNKELYTRDQIKDVVWNLVGRGLAT